MKEPIKLSDHSYLMNEQMINTAVNLGLEEVIDKYITDMSNEAVICDVVFETQNTHLINAAHVRDLALIGLKKLIKT